MVLFQMKPYVINIRYTPNRENFKICSCYISVVDRHSKYFKKALCVLELPWRYPVYVWKPKPRRHMPERV